MTRAKKSEPRGERESERVFSRFPPNGELALLAGDSTPEVHFWVRWRSINFFYGINPVFYAEVFVASNFIVGYFQHYVNIHTHSFILTVKRDKVEKILLSKELTWRKGFEGWLLGHIYSGNHSSKNRWLIDLHFYKARDYEDFLSRAWSWLITCDVLHRKKNVLIRMFMVSCVTYLCAFRPLIFRVEPGNETINYNVSWSCNFCFLGDI